jgi:hypothetical protein
MTDFVQDLERQLVAAAHRRQARRGRRGFGRLTLPARPGRLVLGAVAALAVVVVGLAALTRSDPAVDDRAIGGPPVPSGDAFQFTLPSPGTYTACPQTLDMARRPAGTDVQEALGVLRRPERPLAWKPQLRETRRGGRDESLLPVTTYDERDARGLRAQGIDLLVVPTRGVLAAHCGERLDAADPEPGACLLTRRASFLATRCWPLRAIREGRALTMAAPGDWVAGVVPDGIGTVEVQRPGAKGAYLAVVRDNVFVVKVPGVRRGVRLDVTLRRRGGPRVAFLNGTADPKAARAAERRLRASGYRFRTAAIGDAVTRTLRKSRVYRTSPTGSTALDASEVGGRLGIQDLYEVTEDIRTLAPEADVFVLLGADRGNAPAPRGERRGGGGYEPPAEHTGGGQ